jgi:hypothetical protein
MAIFASRVGMGQDSCYLLCRLQVLFLEVHDRPALCGPSS